MRTAQSSTAAFQNLNPRPVMSDPLTTPPALLRLERLHDLLVEAREQRPGDLRGEGLAQDRALEREQVLPQRRALLAHEPGRLLGEELVEQLRELRLQPGAVLRGLGTQLRTLLGSGAGVRVGQGVDALLE